MSLRYHVWDCHRKVNGHFVPDKSLKVKRPFVIARHFLKHDLNASVKILILIPMCVMIYLVMSLPATERGMDILFPTNSINEKGPLKLLAISFNGSPTYPLRYHTDFSEDNE